MHRIHPPQHHGKLTKNVVFLKQKQGRTTAQTQHSMLSEYQGFFGNDWIHLSKRQPQEGLRNRFLDRSKNKWNGSPGIREGTQTLHTDPNEHEGNGPTDGLAVETESEVTICNLCPPAPSPS